MIFAQLQTVEPHAIKDFILIAGGFVTIAGGLVMMFRKQRVEPQPLQVQAAPDYVTAAQCGQQHDQIVQTIARHEHEIESIWNTLRDENTAIRAEIARGFMRTERQLGEIHGELKQLNNARGDT